MKGNNILIAHPTNIKELGVIKAFLNALDIKFEETQQSPYDQKMVAKIIKAKKSNNRTEINPNDVWGSLGLH